MRKCVMMAAALGTTLSMLQAMGQDLGHPDEKVRLESAGQLLKGKADAVPSLLKAMESDNPTAAKMGRDTLFKLVQASAGSPDAAAVAAALATQWESRTPATRRELCELFGYLGHHEGTLNILTQALGDKELRESARQALVRLQAPAATSALVELLAKADRDFQIALLNGLAEKKDPAAVGAILKLTDSDDEPLRQAAWRALSRLPSAASLEPITQAVKEKKDPYVIGLLFDYADTLLAGGMLQQADTVLKLRNEAGPLDPADTCRQLRAHARLGTPESMDLILAALDSDNARIRGAAFEAAAILPGTEVTRAITQKMIKSSGAVKIDLLNLLGKRGGQMDDRTVMLMYMAVLDKDDAVKIACIRAMQAAGVTSTVPTLLNLVRGPAGPVADAAEQALSRTPGAVVTAQIIDGLRGSNPQGQARLLNVLALRGDPAALPVAIRYAGEADVQVRAAAFNCLGRFGSEEAYDTLLAGLDLPAGPDRDAAERALIALDSDLITAKLLAGYFESPDARKPSLLRVLSHRQLEAIDALLIAESKSPDEKIRAAAVEGLGRRSKPATAQALLEAARTGPTAISDLAIAGYCNAATLVESSDKAAAGRMLLEVLKQAATDTQRKTVLATVGRIGDPATEGLIDAVLPLIAEGNNKAEAADAAVSMVSRLPKSQNGRAIELLEKIASKGGAAADKAGQELRKRRAE